MSKNEARQEFRPLLCDTLNDEGDVLIAFPDSKHVLPLFPLFEDRMLGRSKMLEDLFSGNKKIDPVGPTLYSTLYLFFHRP